MVVSLARYGDALEPPRKLGKAIYKILRVHNPKGPLPSELFPAKDVILAAPHNKTLSPNNLSTTLYIHRLVNMKKGTHPTSISSIDNESFHAILPVDQIDAFRRSYAGPFPDLQFEEVGRLYNPPEVELWDTQQPHNTSNIDKIGDHLQRAQTKARNTGKHKSWFAHLVSIHRDPITGNAMVVAIGEPGSDKKVLPEALRTKNFKRIPIIGNYRTSLTTSGLEPVNELTLRTQEPYKPSLDEVVKQTQLLTGNSFRNPSGYTIVENPDSTAHLISGQGASIHPIAIQVMAYARGIQLAPHSQNTKKTIIAINPQTDPIRPSNLLDQLRSIADLCRHTGAQLMFSTNHPTFAEIYDRYRSEPSIKTIGKSISELPLTPLLVYDRELGDRELNQIFARGSLPKTWEKSDFTKLPDVDMADWGDLSGSASASGLHYVLPADALLHNLVKHAPSVELAEKMGEQGFFESSASILAQSMIFDLYDARSALGRLSSVPDGKDLLTNEIEPDSDPITMGHGIERAVAEIQSTTTSDVPSQLWRLAVFPMNRQSEQIETSEQNSSKTKPINRQTRSQSINKKLVYNDIDKGLRDILRDKAKELDISPRIDEHPSAFFARLEVFIDAVGSVKAQTGIAHQFQRWITKNENREKSRIQQSPKIKAAIRQLKLLEAARRTCW